MNIKKFKVNVVVEKEIEIEINTDVINEDFMEQFSFSMWHVEKVEEIAKHVAYLTATQEGYFLEGVGEWPKAWEREKNLAEQGVHIDYDSLWDEVDISIKEE